MSKSTQFIAFVEVDKSNTIFFSQILKYTERISITQLLNTHTNGCKHELYLWLGLCIQGMLSFGSVAGSHGLDKCTYEHNCRLQNWTLLLCKPHNNLMIQLYEAHEFLCKNWIRETSYVLKKHVKSQLGFEHPTFHMRNEHSNRLPYRRG